MALCRRGQRGSPTSSFLSAFLLLALAAAAVAAGVAAAAGEGSKRHLESTLRAAVRTGLEDNDGGGTAAIENAADADDPVADDGGGGGDGAYSGDGIAAGNYAGGSDGDEGEGGGEEEEEDGSRRRRVLQRDIAVGSLVVTWLGLFKSNWTGLKRIGLSCNPVPVSAAKVSPPPPPTYCPEFEECEPRQLTAAQCHVTVCGNANQALLESGTVPACKDIRNPMRGRLALPLPGNCPAQIAALKQAKAEAAAAEKAAAEAAAAAAAGGVGGGIPLPGKKKKAGLVYDPELMADPSCGGEADWEMQQRSELKAMRLRSVYVDSHGEVFSGIVLYERGGWCYPPLRPRQVYAAGTHVVEVEVALNLVSPATMMVTLTAMLPALLVAAEFLRLRPDMPVLVHKAQVELYDSYVRHFIGIETSRINLVPVSTSELYLVRTLYQPVLPRCCNPSAALWHHLRVFHLLPPGTLPLFHADWSHRVPPADQSPANCFGVPDDWRVVLVAPSATGGGGGDGGGGAANPDQVAAEWYGAAARAMAGVRDQVERLFGEDRVVVVKGDEGLRPLKKAQLLFNNAILLIAPHGPALINAIFMPCGSAIIELRPQLERGSPFSSCYHHMVGAARQHYFLLPLRGGAGGREGEGGGGGAGSRWRDRERDGLSEGAYDVRELGRIVEQAHAELKAPLLETDGKRMLPTYVPQRAR